jgi:hypothetical protein
LKAVISLSPPNHEVHFGIDAIELREPLNLSVARYWSPDHGRGQKIASQFDKPRFDFVCADRLGENRDD